MLNTGKKYYKMVATGIFLAHLLANRHEEHRFTLQRGIVDVRITMLGFFLPLKNIQN